ncbi:MAG TPA: DUF1326 domain-containing protein [Vicinamibacterales bacterium]|nr:DUF1326 domain-containing protein [Vicinamibacterales bacterium]
MRKLVIALAVLLVFGSGTSHTAVQGIQWAMNATVIEACTCPMFCQCYFATKPAAHHDHGSGTSKHFCRFNNAYRINKGTHGATRLDGAKFWVSGDLGGDFSHGQMDWAVVTFDKAMTTPQREAVGAILAQLFPVKWNSLQTAEGSIDKWEFNNNVAHATLDGGRTAEVRLVRQEGNANTPKPPVIMNLRYWGAPRNDGFVLMPNEVQAYRVGPKAYESKGTNGFMVTFDMTSKDVKPGSSN